MSVKIFNGSGDVAGETQLDATWFDAQVNVPVMHQVVVAQMAARRAGTHSTKTRAEVRGGGRKPYKQKGTGRARQGSIRAPHYAGGGIVWGPHPRSHAVKVPKKMRIAALRSALSDRAREGKVAIIESFAFETPKTKDAVALLNRAGVQGKALLVLDVHDENVEKSFRNLPRVHMITVDQLNTYDIIARDWLVFTKAALDMLAARTVSKDAASRIPAAVTAAPETEGGAA